MPLPTDPFPTKLFNIIQQEPKVFKWNLEHDSFRIIDEEELANRVLEQHFRTSRYSSFTRNLNIYGFKKIAKGEFAGSYYHPNFKKGDHAAAMRMRRTVPSKEPAVKNEPNTHATRTNRKPPRPSCKPPTQGNHSRSSRSKNSLPGHAVPVTIKAETVMACPPTAFYMNDSSRQSISSNDDFNFLGDDDFVMEHEQHELALPPTPDDLMDTPLEDDDLTEWKNALESQNNLQPQNKGANAYCVQVPAGPLGATLERKGDKLFLSKVDDQNSPLAHIPLGAQLVNLDGKDTTQMPVCQVSSLDQSTSHRGRMVIFMLNQCFDTALLAMTPTVPEPQRDWGPPKTKCIHDDIDMDTYSSDSSTEPGSPLSSWLNCLYDAM